MTILKIIAAFIIIRIIALGWESVSICANPGEVVSIEAKIAGAFMSIFVYPLYSLDIGGFSEKFQNNSYTTEGCFWKQMISMKSYVWFYIVAWVVAIIGMNEGESEKS